MYHQDIKTWGFFVVVVLLNRSFTDPTGCAKVEQNYFPKKIMFTGQFSNATEQIFCVQHDDLLMQQDKLSVQNRTIF